MLKPVVEVKFAIREALSSGFHCKEDLMKEIASLLAIACAVTGCATMNNRLASARPSRLMELQNMPDTRRKALVEATSPVGAQ
jgi:hypothetical protein